MLPPIRTTRRQFIRIGAFAALSTAVYGQKILGANDRVRVALVGCGIRGPGLLRNFLREPNVEVIAICDPDDAQMDSVARRLARGKLSDQPGHRNQKVDRYRDYRKLYERPDLDAVIIASPNYWHALHAIHAMQAGKDVYVEKPVTFTLWEGRQLAAAERKCGRIISAGYQNRSDKGPQAGIRYVREGNLGKIRKVRSVCYRNRASIGKRDTPLIPPKTMDYDLWLGPCADKPIFRPEIHYDWHWDFNTGNGDLGNQGPHEIDLVCWLLGEPSLPSEVSAFGNRFAWDDAANTPNMITAWFQSGDVEVIFETNDMTVSPTRNVSPVRFQTRTGIVAECEDGYLRGGRGGMVVVAPDGRTILKRFPGDGGKPHAGNFLQAVRENDPSYLTARIADAVTSASMMHLGNVSYRLGSLISEADLRRQVETNGDLLEIIDDQAGQLKAWGITEPDYQFGVTLRVDPERERIVNPEVGPDLVGPHYRKGYELDPIV